MNQGKSSNGGYSQKQLSALGLIDPDKNQWPKKGWAIRLLGTNIPDEDIQQFLSLKDKHLKKKSPGKGLRKMSFTYGEVSANEWNAMCIIYDRLHGTKRAVTCGLKL